MKISRIRTLDKTFNNRKVKLTGTLHAINYTLFAYFLDKMIESWFIIRIFILRNFLT